MSSKSSPSVRGPVATITIPSSGIFVTSPGMTSISGLFLIDSVIYPENSSLSTARAPPAGIALLSAASMIREPKCLSSSLRSPIAFSLAAALNELLHTSSAKFSE